jgi:predicted RNase H-like HicB family nuclease
MKKINLKNVVWKEEKYYIPQCLNIDVSSFGRTRKGALYNLDEALDFYFDDNKMNYELVKVERPEIVTSSFTNV